MATAAVAARIAMYWYFMLDRYFRFAVNECRQQLQSQSVKLLTGRGETTHLLDVRQVRETPRGDLHGFASGTWWFCVFVVVAHEPRMKKAWKVYTDSAEGVTGWRWLRKEMCIRVQPQLRVYCRRIESLAGRRR